MITIRSPKGAYGFEPKNLPADPGTKGQPAVQPLTGLRGVQYHLRVQRILARIKLVAAGAVGRKPHLRFPE